MGKGSGITSERMSIELDTSLPADALGACFDGIEYDGFRSQVREVIEYPSGVRIHGEIGFGKKQVGMFQRFVEDAYGNGHTVRHVEMELVPEYRSRGFAPIFNRAAMQRYRALGIGYASLSASNIGAYVWARDGFEFHPASYDWKATRGKYQDMIRVGARGAASLLEEAREEETGIARLHDIERRVSPATYQAFLDHFASQEDIQAGRLEGKFTTPQQIAQFGKAEQWESQGQQLWCGKAFLIDSQWDGILKLN